MVFKVNHMVKGQPWTKPNLFYSRGQIGPLYHTNINTIFKIFKFNGKSHSESMYVYIEAV